MEEKPEFDLSSLTQEQSQNNGQDTIPNRVVKLSSKLQLHKLNLILQNQIQK